ncbi:MAG: arginine--tRNA ligase [Gemmataceae bacterium]|nr:arginine--tRNA ligase [Gemmataceae bacterium]
MNLARVIQDRFRPALAGLVADPEPYVAMVKPTQDAKHGDYQANCAMSLSKTLGKKPRDIAQDIVARLDRGDLLEPPEIAGPGFINLRLQSSWLARQLQTMAADDRLGVAPAQPPKTFVIDFSSPNVAKPMHVGHLRSTIIGDALARLLRFLGHTVVTDNHLGDWGTQFGMILFGYKNFVHDNAFVQDPVRELSRLYVLVREISKAAEDDDEANDAESRTTLTAEGRQIAQLAADASRKETAKLHAADPENVRLWQLFMPHCMEEIERSYRRLDVKFDHTHGESFYNPMLRGVVESLLEQKVAEPGDDGAIIIRFTDKNVALVQKRDGAFTYTTSDLATIRHRMDAWHPDAILYVVDFRQALHFKNLFAAARCWGFDQVALEHISFGSVLGKDGKPIKTREGGAVELGALLDEAIERAAQVYDANVQESRDRGDDVPDLSDAERRQIHEAVGVGAVKYADLSQNRASNYVFDFDKMLAMNGNTATYMQYAYARNRSIFRKGNVDVARFRANPPPALLDTPHERALALQLLRLEEALARATEEYHPSEITSYLWDLSKTYSGFFQNCPVLKAETPALRDSRLLLCDLTARVIRLCLDLLGIRTVERM